jgi:hypothetical protein
MLILPLLLIVLTLLYAARGNVRVGGVTGAGSTSAATAVPATQTAPVSTPAQTASAAVSLTPSGAPTVAPTSTPFATVPVVVSPSPLQTVPRPSGSVAPTTTPGPVVDDHGNTPQTGTPLTAGTFVNGTIDPATDVDWFRFNVAVAGQVLVELKGKTLNAGAIALFAANATTGGVTEIGTEDVDNGNGASVLATAKEPGFYFARVRSTRGDTGTSAVAYSLIGR